MLGGVLLILVGFVLVFYKGFPNRYPNNDRALLIQLIDYKGSNQQAFNKLKLRKFTKDGKPRVALIGDSYAMDLFNILNKWDKIVSL